MIQSSLLQVCIQPNAKVGYKENTCTLFLTTALFTVEATQVSAGRQMHKENGVYVQTMEYNAIFQKKEIMSHGATWMNLKD
jgi:hypothetical protein